MKKTILFFIIIISISNLFAQNYAPGDNELLFTPTAYTMPAGNSYFTDYELYLLNYTYAITDRTHIGVFLPFPITTDFIRLVTLGIKQNYFKTEWLQSAVFASYTFDSSLLVFGNSVSVGSPTNGANLSGGLARFMDNSDSNLLYLSFGYRFDPSENTSIIAEISQLFFKDEKKQSYSFVFPGGMMSLLFRIRSTHLAWDLGAFRPLDMEDIDIIAFPVLKVSYYFF